MHQEIKRTKGGSLTRGLGAALLMMLPVLALGQDAPAPTPPNKGDIAWLMTCTVLVILMTIPGLALFYGGMVRGKNVLSVLMQVFIIFCVGALLFAAYGYSVAFTGGETQFFGGFSRVFLDGLSGATAGDALLGTFSKSTNIPELGFFCFQLTFAAITPALIVGAFAERVKFGAILVFIIIWLTFSYYPIAHMVWFWSGPDAFNGADAAAAQAAGDLANANAGFLWAKGALDFAGGTVVHINAGVAGLVGAVMVGKRIGFGQTALPPHNLPMVMIGAALLWVGWFGFNVGSNLEANGFATLVFTNTILATAAATLGWMLVEWMVKGSPTMLGAASGAVAGLVAITPACGWVGPMGSIAIGVIAGIVCLWACSGLKRMLGYDDSLDVFGVHCIGGIVGALLTGVFNSPALGGTDVYNYATNAWPDPANYSIAAQVTKQAIAVGVTVLWSAVVSVIGFFIVKLIFGLRVSEEQEREGLDTTQHGERAYD